MEESPLRTEPLDNRLFTYLSAEKNTTPFEPVQITFNGEFIDSTGGYDEISFFELISNASIVTNTLRKEATEERTKENKRKKRQRGDYEKEAEIVQTTTQRKEIYRVKEITVGDKTYTLPKDLPLNAKTEYIMNDREEFIQFINKFMKKSHGDQIAQDSDLTCDNLYSRGGPEFSLLTHQQVVRDYMNVYTPYRGLLLYNGLGSGKTCTSIAIAEGMKSSKRIIVMVPASLRESYLSELKKCGDVMYRKDKHWDWINVYDAKRKTYNEDLIKNLSAALGIEQDNIRKKKGAFLIDITKNTSNYGSLALSPAQAAELAAENKEREKRGEPQVLEETFLREQQKLLNQQIDLMIANKYTFISYNGLRKRAYLSLARPAGQKNLFDNSVVIIDEGHNLVSRIINKLNFKDEFDESEKELTPREINEAKEQSKNLAGELRRLFMDSPAFTKEKEKTLKNKLSLAKKNSKFVIISKEEMTEVRSFNKEQVEKVISRLENRPSTVLKMEIPLSVMIYADLMRAKNTRVVVLTGTPVINKANEMGVLFNILRGYIVTFEFQIEGIVDKDSIERCVRERAKSVDYVDYDNKILTVTRDPVGFTNAPDKYPHVRVNREGENSSNDDDIFVRNLSEILTQDCGVNIKSYKIVNNKALPDSKEVFEGLYIDENTKTLKDPKNLQRRIMGLTSYFRSAQENLLPRYVKKEDFEIVYVNMSRLQFEKYSEKLEAEKKDVNTGSDTYKMFTRLICNYAVNDRPYPMPLSERRGIKRGQTDDEIIIDSVFNKKRDRDDLSDANEEVTELDELMEEIGGEKYKAELVAKVQDMIINRERYFSLQNLESHSPKFKAVISKINSRDNIGLNLVYSQFRSFEGLTLFSLALEFNGFCPFKLQFVNSNWVVDPICLTSENIRKPKFGMYGDDGNKDKRDVLRSIYNGDWENLNEELKGQLVMLYEARRDVNSSPGEENNNFGEVMKVFMITSSGSEGINLRNTRYVHILEPYWHPVRIQQVIGRARRICSHKNLPEEFRTVKVFLYITIFTPDQKATFKKKEDQETTDEYLDRISNEKEVISDALTKAMKESAFDCNLYPHDPSEGINCLTFGKKSTQYSFRPSFNDGINENLERPKIQRVLSDVVIEGKEYLISEKEADNNFSVYDKAMAERGEEELKFRVRLSSDGKTYKKIKSK
jgi:hypothetical protein